jgi:hypothetical protein
MLLELQKYKQNTANEEKKNPASFYQNKRWSKKQEGSGENAKPYQHDWKSIFF